MTRRLARGTNLKRWLTDCSWPDRQCEVDGYVYSTVYSALLVAIQFKCAPVRGAIYDTVFHPVSDF